MGLGSVAALLFLIVAIVAEHGCHAQTSVTPAPPSGSICPKSVPANDAEPTRWLRWSSRSTWHGRPPPGTAKASLVNVVIGCGRNVLFDLRNTKKTPIRLGILNITGVLKIVDSPRVGDVEIWANHIVVHGRLIIGSETKQFKNKVRILLTADTKRRSELNIRGHTYGHKSFVISGGRVSLHGMPGGAATPSWARLAVPAPATTRTIITDRDVSGWPVGGRVALSSTSCWFTETDEAGIVSVAPARGGGSLLLLDAPLLKTHWGGAVASGVPGVKVDPSGEVALLTRNIRIEGQAEGGAFALEGGHFISAYTGVPQAIEGVEFTRLGQQGTLGRYPVHFHFNGRAPSSYVRKCAVHETYQRCVVVHATHGVTVADNVAYNTSGHCFITEDGIETDNKFLRNLGFLTNKVQKVIPSGGPQDGPGFERNDDNPSTFWMSNPNNTLIGNVGGGSAGQAFWINLHDRVNGLSFYLPDANGYRPNNAPFQEFDSNTGHSSLAFFTYPGLAPTHANTSAPGWSATAPDAADAPWFKISRLTAWKVCFGPGIQPVSARRLWFDGATMFANRYGLDTVFTDSDNMLLTNSLVVGFVPDNAFTGGPWAPRNDSYAINVGLRLGYWQRSLWTAGAAPGAGSFRARNVTFAGFPGGYSPASAAVQLSCTLDCRPGQHARAGVAVEGIRIADGSLPIAAKRYGASVLKDLDGSLTGRRQWVVSTESLPWQGSGACTPSPLSPLLSFCPATLCIRSVSLQVPLPMWNMDGTMSGPQINVTVVREDNGVAVPVAFEAYQAWYWNQLAGVAYTVTFSSDPPWFNLHVQDTGCSGRAILNFQISNPSLIYTFPVGAGQPVLPLPCGGVGALPPAADRSYVATWCGVGDAPTWRFDAGVGSPAVAAVGAAANGTSICDSAGCSWSVVPVQH